MNKNEPLNITLDEGKRALKAHAREKGYWLYKKYGSPVSYEKLQKILKDSDFVRFPTQIKFDETKLESDTFAISEKCSGDASDGYIIYVHPYFKNHLESLAPLVFYHLVSVNYGDFATYEDSEEFGSAALNMDKDSYYDLICKLNDLVPRKNES